jgi:hypothetical protein
MNVDFIDELVGATEALTDTGEGLTSYDAIMSYRNEMEEKIRQEQKKPEPIVNGGTLIVDLDLIYELGMFQEPSKMVMFKKMLEYQGNVDIYIEAEMELASLVLACPFVFHVIRSIQGKTTLKVSGYATITHLAIGMMCDRVEFSEFSSLALFGIYPRAESRTSHIVEEMADDVLEYWKERKLLNDEEIAELKENRTSALVIKNGEDLKDLS